MHVVICRREPSSSWEDLLPTPVTGGCVGTKCVNLEGLGLNFGPNFCFTEHLAVYVQFFWGDIEIMWESQSLI